MLPAALDLLGRGPDIADPYVLAVLALADRLAHEVLEHGARERVGDDQRRGGEEIRAQARVDARFGVAVSREHRGADEIVLGNRLVARGVERPGMADAGGADGGGDVGA